MSSEHNHGHAAMAGGHEKPLWIALGLTSAFLVAELIGAWLTHSLALFSDAAHMFTDTAALGISLAAIRIGKRAADNRRTYGYYRFEILAAAVNATLLFGVAIFILIEAVQRFREPPEIQSIGMGAIAVLGLIVNLISMRILQGGSESSLNVKGAHLEVWSDMLGSIGVIIAAVVIYLTGWRAIDPIVAVLIGLWVLPRTWTLLKHAFNILLEGVPAGMDVAQIEEEILATPGVTSVHDLHVWAVTSGKAVLTAHVVREENHATTDAQLQAHLRERLIGRFAIHHTTLQVEQERCDTPDCVLTSEQPHTDYH
ncbi:MAG: cation diffusion facilitator family transporter [Dokdonella sp.]